MNSYKKSIRKIQYSVKNLFYPNAIKVDYARKKNNFGDILNPIVIEFFANRKTTRVASAYYGNYHLLAIGSILNRATKYSIVWGSGFIEEDSCLIDEPHKILAVRGPKTRQRLLELNIECPIVYGDPALLMPLIHNPKIQKKYKLGIIPHYVDFKDERLQDIKDESVKIIDICNPNPLLVIDEMMECECIASSSLHGLIISDAYKIPNIWIKFSDKVTGGSFKFEDYFESISRENTGPYLIEDQIDISYLTAYSKSFQVELDIKLLIQQFQDFIKTKEI